MRQKGQFKISVRKYSFSDSSMLRQVKEATSRGRLGLASIWRTRSCNGDGCSSCSGTGATEEAVPASQTRAVALSGVLRNCRSTDTDELIAKPWFIAGTSRLPRGSHAINRWQNHCLAAGRFKMTWSWHSRHLSGKPVIRPSRRQEWDNDVRA